MDKLKKLEKALKQWQECANTLRSGEPCVSPDGVQMHAEMQEGMHELDLLSCEKKILWIKERIDRAPLKENEALVVVEEEKVKCDNDALKVIKKDGLNIEDILSIVDDRLSKRPDGPEGVTLRDVMVYKRRQIAKEETSEPEEVKPAANAPQGETEEKPKTRRRATRTTKTTSTRKK